MLHHQTKYKEFNFEASIKFLSHLGCDIKEVREGSMPWKTLSKLCKHISGVGLQVGGFVGMTHCFLASQHNIDIVFTIDPNIMHRNIKNTLNKCSDMINYFGLQDKSVLIQGLSEHQMPILNNMKIEFDFVLLDGNHNYTSIIKEVKMADNILKTGGYLILDDIDFWRGPKSVYNNFPLKNYNKIFIDRRAGLLIKCE